MDCFNNLSDEQLVRMVRNGDDNAFNCLYSRYLPKIKTMSYSFQGYSYEIDDLVQEATIGFFTAINAYNFGVTNFSTFCYLCMRRMLIGVLKKSLRKKEIPNGNIVPLEEISDVSESPERIIIAKEDFKFLQEQLFNRLSNLEREVLFMYFNGESYEKISEKLSISKKSVDNALQRIKKKITKKS